jgi:hypothetical protein
MHICCYLNSVCYLQDRAAHLRRELALELAEQHADIAAAAAVGDANGGYSYNITIQSTVVTGSLDSVHDIRGALEADWRAMDVKVTVRSVTGCYFSTM